MSAVKTNQHIALSVRQRAPSQAVHSRLMRALYKYLRPAAGLVQPDVTVVVTYGNLSSVVWAEARGRGMAQVLVAQREDFPAQVACPYLVI